MKLVVFSDLHLDSQFSWLGLDSARARRRRQALRDTLDRIVQLVQTEGADALLCGGDLYETARFTPDTVRFVSRAFDRLHPVPVFLAPGNHDWLGLQSLYDQAEWSPNVHVFPEQRLTPFALDDGITLWGAAHHGPAITVNLLEGFRVDRGGVNLGLFHGSEQTWFTQQEEGKIPYAPFQAVDIERAGLDHAFLGHFHRPLDAARHTYPGNPDPLAFGEDGERAAVLVTVRPDGSIDRARRPVATTACHDLQIDISNCASQQEIRELIESRVAGLEGVARITLHGELGTDVDARAGDFQDLAPHLDGLVVRWGHVRPAYDLEAISVEPTVRGQFVRSVLAASLAEDAQRRVLITGLRALDGRDDLEVE